MKRSELVGIASLFLILVVLYGSPSCKKKVWVQDTHAVYTAELANVVSHATNGPIGSTDPIVLRFVNPEIQPSEVDSRVDNDVFVFTPAIEGTATWKDTRTLVFKPKKRLPFQTAYAGHVFFNQLLPKYKFMKPLSLSFNTTSRDILSLNADFQLVRQLDPSEVKFQGVIAFTEPLPLEQVKKAVSFNDGKNGLPLEWSIQKENVTFFFSSKPLKRTTKLQKFYLNINKKIGELRGKFHKVFELTSLEDMKIIEVRKFDQGEHPGIEISFSDELAPQQDKTGLIRVLRDKTDKNPETLIPIQLKTMKKSVYVEGKFIYNESLTLKVSGIQSKWGTGLQKEYVETFVFKDKKPELAFLSNGLFLPSANGQKLGFKTMNLKRVHLQIEKVFESNLGQFLQTEKINGSKTRSTGFNYQHVTRVGVPVINQTLEIGTTKNKWLSMQLDLEKRIKPGEKGLFLVHLNFEQDDMISEMPPVNDYDDEYDEGDYNNNYRYNNAWQRHSSICKAVVLSDIGLMVKQSSNNSQYLVFATHIADASPLANVKISLRTFQNQIFAAMVTDKEGKALFKNVNQKAFYIEGERNGQRSFILPAEMAWNTSAYDTGGEEDTSNLTRAYIYTERGVYRPGDEINIFNYLPKPRAHNWFKSPDRHMITLNVCLETGFAAGPDCDKTIFVQSPASKKPLPICPFHKRFFVTPDEKQQVCSLCWEPGQYKSITKLLYPPDIAQYLRESGIIIAPIPKHKKGCSAENNSGSNPVRIIYPVANAKLWIPRDFDGQLQQVTFRVAHRTKDSRVYWYIDNIYKGTTASNHKLVNRLTHGPHTLEVVDDSGNRTQRKFFVSVLKQ